MSNTLTKCDECGWVYDWKEIEPPEDATFYWQPHCPKCKGDTSGVRVDEQYIEIGMDTYRNTKDSGHGDPEEFLERLSLKARYVHGYELQEWKEREKELDYE